jgi:hypothetical protein
MHFSLQSLQRNYEKNSQFVAANSTPSLQEVFEFANKNAHSRFTTASLAVSLQTPNPTHAKFATNAPEVAFACKRGTLTRHSSREIRHESSSAAQKTLPRRSLGGGGFVSNRASQNLQKPQQNRTFEVEKPLRFWFPRLY